MNKKNCDNTYLIISTVFRALLINFFTIQEYSRNGKLFIIIKVLTEYSELYYRLYFKRFQASF